MKIESPLKSVGWLGGLGHQVIIDEEARQMAHPYPEHHWRRNWFFSRGVAGDVHIVKRSGKSVTASATIPAAEWATIIASVSSEGDTAEKYTRAQRFHGVRP